MRNFLISTDEEMSHDWVTGRVDWVVHWNWYTDGSDVRWGTGKLNVAGGIGHWDLVYKGERTPGPNGVVTYEVAGTGKGEILRGLRAHWFYTSTKAGVFKVEGTIIRHGR
jgi:hypothetical protein